ncbi:MAG: nuclease-related domain-containing protein [Limnohabitans sp.]
MQKITEVHLFIALSLSIGYLLGRLHKRYRSANFQNRGEALVTRAIKSNFSAPDYHLLNHITLKLKDGTTQIDHILVSRFGVFVIETKDYSGWIFANPNTATWTQTFFKSKFQFQNPILQNARHVQAVQKLLDFLPHTSIKPIVVFAGSAEFMTDIPTGVFSIPAFIEHVKNFNEEEMSLNRLQFCVGRLETARLAISGKTDLEHLQSLERRHRTKT